MNCAKHPEVTAAAYCRTCGKALCEACKRDVRGVIYCEDCLATRVAGTMPPATAGTAATAVPVAPSSGPHPAVAGVLAGFFPFGVGQVYNGQYARGLAHMAIFIALIWALDHGGSFDVIFGIAMAAFYFYQIIDAVRSARAIQMGVAPPDPFGFDNLFGGRGTVQRAPAYVAPAAAVAPAAGVAPPEGAYTPPQPAEMAKTERNAPLGAIILICLGVLFLFGNLGFFHWFWVERLWPLVLIIPGLWMLANRWESLAAGNRCGLMGPAVLLTLGAMFMLHTWHVAPFHRTLPILLIVIGVVLVVQRTGSTAPPPPGPPTGTNPSGTPQLPEPVQHEHER